MLALLWLRGLFSSLFFFLTCVCCTLKRVSSSVLVVVCGPWEWGGDYARLWVHKHGGGRPDCVSPCYVIPGTKTLSGLLSSGMF